MPKIVVTGSPLEAPCPHEYSKTDHKGDDSPQVSEKQRQPKYDDDDATEVAEEIRGCARIPEKRAERGARYGSRPCAWPGPASS